MDRIESAFARGKEENRALFVAYLCAGDPDEETSFQMCRALADVGVDILELGVPFSDPLADGLTNQHAAERALASGMNQEKVFRLTRRVREYAPELPIIYYTYYNLVYSNGIEQYVKRAQAAGVDGMLTLDLPPEEAGDLQTVCAEVGIKTVFIIAPTTPKERIRTIADATSGFLYYVSREGVTGVRHDLASGMHEAVATIREVTDRPLVVGFGISREEQVRDVAAAADGVVVGSALVNCVPDSGDSGGIVSCLRSRMEALLPGLSR